MALCYALAAELARPVVCEYLTLTKAHAALLATTLRAKRLGQLGDYDVRDVYRMQQHLLGLHIKRQAMEHAMAEQREWLAQRRRHG
jgi:hypothetical protein